MNEKEFIWQNVNGFMNPLVKVEQIGFEMTLEDALKIYKTIYSIPLNVKII